MKSFVKQYKHAWVLLYFFLYAPWFTYLEKTITVTYQPVHIKLDDYILFNEWFIIPYYVWFAFNAIVLFYLFFYDVKGFYLSTAFFFIGMTICLIIYTIWPNGQNLRPNLDLLGRDNILIDIVRNLYQGDTNTNVCPSIHVYNSLGACIAVFHTSNLRKKTWITIPTLILTVLICMSTAFLKQHSVFDGICATLLASLMYLIIYVPNYVKLRIQKKERLNQLQN